MHRLAALLVLSIAALMAVGETAGAEVVTNVRFPNSVVSTDTCNGDFATLIGDVHILIRVDDDGNMSQEVNAHYQGVGTSGAEYVLNVQQKIDQTIDPAAFSLQIRTVLVTKGTGENQIGTLTITSPPGTVTQTFDCHG